MSHYKTIAESNNFIVLDKYIKHTQLSEAYQSEYDFVYRLNAFEIKSTISAPMRACASSVEAPMCGVLLTRGCL